MTKMIKIMFVCHGNICRSPMAEFVLADMLEKKHLSNRICVASCAVSTEEIRNGVGNPVHPGTAAELARLGISCKGKRAVLLQREDYDRYDLFVAMDQGNVRAMHRIFGGDPQEKICKLLDFTESGGDVADPWYTDRFDITMRDVRRGCTALLEYLMQ